MADNDNVHMGEYPPVASDDLIDAHAYNNIGRVVVTQTGVYGLTANGGWIRFVPIREKR